MKYAQIRQYDIANGPGIRTSIFVTGCTLKCRNCFNPEYQDFNFGNDFDDAAFEKLVNYVNDRNVKGLSVLGGEPMENAEDLSLVLKKLRGKMKKGKDIWIYSGYTFEKIKQDPIKTSLLEQCDVLVDGPFVEELADMKLKFRGSSNQRIINVKASLAEGKTICMKL